MLQINSLLCFFRFFIYANGYLLLLLSIGTTNIFLIKNYMIPYPFSHWLCFTLLVPFIIKLLRSLFISGYLKLMWSSNHRSVLLAGILLKVGSYAIYVFLCFYFLMLYFISYYAIHISTISIIYSSLTVLRQTDCKKIVATLL